MDLMRETPDNHFDLAIVDPPYGIGWDREYEVMSAGVRKDGTKRKMATWNNPKPKKYKRGQWDNAAPPPEYFEELRRVSKKQIVWGGNYFTEHLPPSGGWVTWEKGVPDGMSLSQCEMAWNNCLNSVRHIKLLWAGYKKCEESQRMHPTQKPVKLYNWLLENYAKPGQRILDTHMGSGSIAIACHYFGAYLTATEIDGDYFKAACERIENETRQMDLFQENSSC
jgi:site-specific DNA-methyltransferase (adenine-specific)